MPNHDTTRDGSHVLAKIAKAISVSTDPTDRHLYRVVMDQSRGRQRVLTNLMPFEDALNWRAHLIAAMVEACL